MPLNDLTLRKLRVPVGKRVEIWDGKLPGFGVRASGKTKTFVLLYRLNGRAQRMTLGRYPARTLADARELALAALSKIARNEDPRGHVRAATNGATFAEAVELFLERYAAQHTRPSSQAQTARVLRGHFGRRLQNRAIATITKDDIHGVLDGLLESERPIAANNARVVAGRFFNWCVERHLVPHSPVAGIRRPARPKSRERVLSDKELAAVWAAASMFEYPFGLIVRLLILTGQRRNEVGGMRWADIDLNERLWHIPSEITKNHRAHTLPLSTAAEELIREIPRVDDVLVFPSLRGNERSFSGFGKCKKRLDVAAEVSSWTLHDIRRTVATHMARLGVAPHVVERVLNHVSGTLGGVAGVYNRFGYLPEMRTALELWADQVAQFSARR